MKKYRENIERSLKTQDLYMIGKSLEIRRLTTMELRVFETMSRGYPIILKWSKWYPTISLCSILGVWKILNEFFFGDPWYFENQLISLVKSESIGVIDRMTFSRVPF